MSTAALSRNPSRPAASWKMVAGLAARLIRCFRGWMKLGKDRRTLQTVPAHILADMGLERMEIRTTTGDHEVWLKPRR